MQTLHDVLSSIYYLLAVVLQLASLRSCASSHWHFELLKQGKADWMRFRGIAVAGICLFVLAVIAGGWLVLRPHHLDQAREAKAQKAKHDFDCAAASLAAAIIYERRGMNSDSARATYVYFSARPKVDPSAVPLRAQLMIDAAGGDMGKEATDVLAKATLCTDDEIVEVGTRH